jgi:hypothetical protein
VAAGSQYGDEGVAVVHFYVKCTLWDQPISCAQKDLSVISLALMLSNLI